MKGDATKFLLGTIPINDGGPSSPLLGSGGSQRFGTTELAPASPKIASSRRVMYADAFRGILVAGMIICELSLILNGYEIFMPQEWDGLSFYDLLLPAFLFSMGLNIAFTTDTLMSKDQPKKPLVFKVLKRGCLLFLLGFFVVNFPNGNLATWRVFGPLQRISFCYMIVSLIVLGFPHNRDGRIPRVFFQYLYQWGFVFALVVIYCAVIFGTKVECPIANPIDGSTRQERGDIGPYCNVAYAVDEEILTRDHMFAAARCKADTPVPDLYDDNIYSNPVATAPSAAATTTTITDTERNGKRKRRQVPIDLDDYCIDFEPDGVMGTFTSTFTVFVGLHAGRVIRHYVGGPSQSSQRMVHWGSVSAICFLLALPLDLAGWVPYNRNLYSVSLMLISVPINMVLLACCYAMYEVYDKPMLIKPFEFLGVNSLFFYCSTLLLVSLLQALYHGDRENTLWSNITDWTDGNEGNVLVFASLYLLLVICPLAYVLYDNGYVLKF